MKQIFISYSHEDEKWKDKLVKHLKVLEPEGHYRLWDDRKIGVGSDWLPQIEKAIKYAKKAVSILEALFPGGHPNLEIARKNLSLVKGKAK